MTDDIEDNAPGLEPGPEIDLNVNGGDPIPEPVDETQNDPSAPTATGAIPPGPASARRTCTWPASQRRESDQWERSSDASPP